MATSVDYTGRTIDLFIFQGAKPAGDQKITLALSNDVTTGIQKLVQRFTTLFLTERGSVPQEPEKGSDFLVAMRLGRLRDEADIRAEFILAVEQVRVFLDLDAQTRDLPLDEVFVNAKLSNFNVDRSTALLTLHVQVSSAAGSSRVVYLPIPVAIK